MTRIASESRRARPGAAGTKRARRSLYGLVKKLHMYAGLLSFSNFVAYGIAGLVATFSPPPEQRRLAGETRYVPFTVPAGLTDKALADSIYRLLDPPLAGPIPEWAIRRDDAGHLLLNFYTVNGPHRVTVLEEENRLRVETMRNSVWRFLSNVHATTVRDAERVPDWRLKLWAYHNEIALWALSFMALSGVYLWLATRPRLRFALAAFLGGSGAFLLLYGLTR